MRKLESKSIVYVNYSPYENSGKILDYLLENFNNVCLFSIGFHNLENKKDYNNLSIYQQGKLLKTYSLFQLHNSSKFIFVLIPIRSIITLLEIIFYTIWLKHKLKRIDAYFTANAFTAWIGRFLKSLGVVQKTVFWVWDYYPPIHENKLIMLMRYIYWQFDKISSHSDRVAFVNNRLLILRKDIGIYEKNAIYPIVPIGSDRLPFPKLEKKNRGTIVFGFIGVLKKSQGVDLIFDKAPALLKEFRNIQYEIVGSGPDEKYLKKQAKKSAIKTNFYGYLEGDSFNDVLKKCDIGIATYTPEASNVSKYGDPGKVKRYLSLGIPIITTNVIEFADEIEKSGAGVIIEYGDQKALLEAVKKIMNKHIVYRKNAYKLAQKFYYKDIYPQLFSDLN
jgi:glycosyltransferase involved in cell wall biosynthesis